MPDTRDRILDAAAHVMRTRGFARTTPKEIARAAGYSEATLYKHFTDKTDLFLAVLKERLPSLGSTLGALSAALDADSRSPAGPATRERLARRLAGTARRDIPPVRGRSPRPARPHPPPPPPPRPAPPGGGPPRGPPWPRWPATCAWN